MLKLFATNPASNGVAATAAAFLSFLFSALNCLFAVGLVKFQFGVPSALIAKLISGLIKFTVLITTSFLSRGKTANETSMFLALTIFGVSAHSALANETSFNTMVGTSDIFKPAFPSKDNLRPVCS